jgi:phosphonate degradation associated HDIG domain protein
MTAPTPVAWRNIDDAETLVDSIITVFEATGDNHYDEDVTQNQHATQTALLARGAGASDELVAAALLHDLGHLLLDEHDERNDFLDRDLHHEDVAARFLSSWFEPAVTEPIRLHVAAKRYLCAIDHTYAASLSDASVASLAVQGGPMTDDEVAAFRVERSADDAAELRRWDDLAKDPDAASVPVRSFADLLTPLVVFGR